jgi:hypothetical protein
VALTNVEECAAPFHVTADVVINPLPFSVRTEPAPNVVILLGEMPVSVGVGLLIANDNVLDVPPPGAGFVTVICPVPPEPMSAAVSATFNAVELTNVVVLLVLFHNATEVETKPLPVIVTVVPLAPAVTLVGDNAVIAGCGFGVGAGVEELPPPPAHPQRSIVAARENTPARMSR